MDRPTTARAVTWMWGALLAGALVSPAAGQQAYFAITGDFNTAGDEHRFFINTSRSLADADFFGFITKAYGGGASFSGDTIASGGIDSVLELFNANTNVSVGYTDAIDESTTFNYDTFLGWDAAVPLSANGTRITEPLPAGDYRLHLSEFGSDAVGPWHVDVLLPSDAATLEAVSRLPGTTSTVDSFKFGTNDGIGIAVFNNNINFTIAGPLVVANTGAAALNQQGDTLTVNGTTTVNSGGAINLSGGTFNANGNVTLNGGSFSKTAGTFNLGNNRTVGATNYADFFHAGALAINNGQLYNFASGADLETGGGLNLGTNGTLGQLFATGDDTTVFVGAASTWGSNDGTGNVTLADGAFASLKQLTLGQGGIGGGGAGSFTIQSGASVNLDSFAMGTGGGARNTSLTVTGEDSAFNVRSDAPTVFNTVYLGFTTFDDGSTTINVNDSGRFSSGLGLTTIDNNATVNINTGGQFNVNGDLVLYGDILSDATGSFDVDGNLDLHGATLSVNLDEFSENLFGAGKTLTADGASQITLPPSLLDAFFLFDDRTVILNDGSDLMTGEGVDIGTITDAAMIVDGVGSSLTTNTSSATPTNVIGQLGGSGELTVRNGATANLNSDLLWLSQVQDGSDDTGTINVETGGTLNTTANVRVATESGSAAINVSAAGSSFVQTGNRFLIVGRSGPGTAAINVTSGGVFTTGTDTTTVNANGVINLGTGNSGEGGTFNANGNVVIDGGAFNLKQDSTFNLAAGKKITVQNGGRFNSVDYTLPGGTTLELKPGADADISRFDIGNNATGTLTADGEDTTLDVGFFSIWGFNGGTANATFSNNAAFLSGSSIDMGNGSGSNATVNINSGATFTTSNFGVGLNGATGALTVAGTGSTFHKTGAASTGVGSAGSTGSAQINITSGGVFDYDQGNMIVRDTGTVTVNGGTLNHGGTLTLDGGTVNLTTGRINADTIDHTHGGTFNFTGGTLAVDTFNGNLTQAGGTLGDPDTITKTTITGNYTITDGTVDIEFGLAEGFADSDWVDVDGVATLGGTLRMTSIDGFSLAPNLGSTTIRVSHLVVEATEIVGTFDTLILPDPEGVVYASVDYDEDSVWIVIQRAILTGDANNDAVVDAADYLAVESNFGSLGNANGTLLGDANDDGRVDGADLIAIDRNFGATFTFPGQPVPEPGTLGLLLALVCAVHRRRTK